MKIAIIQTKLFFGDVDANYQLMENKIREAMTNEVQQPDTIMLSEMWNTSFFPANAKYLADRDGKRTQAFLAQLAHELNVNIVGGSVATLRDGNLYNTAYIFNRQGKLVASYNKVHLFSPSGEHELFTAGNTLGLFELDGIKCGINICYDLRFSEWTRMHALQDISILFLPAAWPDVRITHWNVLNRAHAIENQMFVACSNSIGKTDKIQFGGNSAIIDPWGEYVIKPDAADAIKVGEVDLSVIKDIRERINVLRDRRQELYQL